MNANAKYYLRKDEVRGRRDGQALAYLLRFAKPYQRSFIFALALIFSSGMVVIVSARLMGILVEDGLKQQNWDKAGILAGIIVSLEIIALLLVWRGRKILSAAASKSILLIRKTVFRHIHELPMAYYDREPQGRTVTRMTHDVEGIEEFFTSSLGRLISSVVIFSMAMVAMLATDFRLGILLVISIIPAILLLFLTRNQMRVVNREMSKNNSACNAKLAEFLNGLPVIRSFGLENWSKEQYDQVVDGYLQSGYRANEFNSWSRPLISAACMLPTVGLVWWGGHAVLEGSLALGIFVAFVRYCERFTNPIVGVSREIHVIQHAFTSAERVSAFLKAASEDDVLGANGEFRPTHLKGTIDFVNVKMGYDSEVPVLKDVSFRVSSGEKIGLVGTTGSGKSTTVSLLARLYEFQEGEVKIDGVSVRDFNRESLRKNLGFVSQEVVIFRGTFRENLTINEAVTDREILEAAERTGLLKVLTQNKLTLNSEILEGGANLSVGERQLVSLTRVLLNNPSILILDEATANVDPMYERIIHKAVDHIMEGRTCLIIAHRLETLESCDRIFVFRSGQLVEHGPQEELLQKKGYFYNLQQKTLREGGTFDQPTTVEF